MFLLMLVEIWRGIRLILGLRGRRPKSNGRHPGRALTGGPERKWC